MTDEQLIKDIAKIAELEYGNGRVLCHGDWVNPLLDSMRAKALCWELMVTYKVSLLDEFYTGVSGVWVAEIHPAEYTKDKNPNKALFLAIVESNKDELR